MGRLFERIADELPPGKQDTVTLSQIIEWNEVLCTITEHRGYIYALAAASRYLISGSGDSTAKVRRNDHQGEPSRC